MELSVLNVGSGFLYCKNDYASLESIHRLVIKSNYFFIFLDCPRSAGWREHPDQRRRFPFDAREDERGYRRPRSGSGSLEDERDSLPEWCLEDAEEEAGTFDSSGAFHSHKVSGDLAVVFFFFVIVTQNQMFYFFYLNQSFKIMYICFWPFSKKLPRSQSWKKQSLNLSHWKSVRRVWRRRTFGPWRPKKQTWRPKERLTEKVSHLLFSRESLHLSHVWQGFLQTFGIQTKQLKQCF